MTASVKCVTMTFFDVDICHRMATLRLLYSVTLTLIFKSNMFLLSVWYKNASSATAEVAGRFASTRTALAVELLLSWDWSAFVLNKLDLLQYGGSSFEQERDGSDDVRWYHTSSNFNNDDVPFHQSLYTISINVVYTVYLHINISMFT